MTGRERQRRAQGGAVRTRAVRGVARHACGHGERRWYGPARGAGTRCACATRLGATCACARGRTVGRGGALRERGARAGSGRARRAAWHAAREGQGRPEREQGVRGGSRPGGARASGSEAEEGERKGGKRKEKKKKRKRGKKNGKKEKK